MNGNELAERRTGVKLRRKIAEAIGPAGVFFRGFLEHPRMVGSIIPSSRNTIEKMLAPVYWSECRLFVALLVVTIVASAVFGLIFGLLGTEVARVGDSLISSLANAAWATIFLSVLSAVHDQLVGPSASTLSETFE
jgi:hypothetical protein